MAENEKIDHAQEIVQTSMYYAMGLGIVPIPVFDFVAVTVVQLDMLRRLCKLYEVKFLESKGKNLIGALVGGGFSSTLSPILASLVKLIPVVGSTLGALSMPILAGSSTYAVGKVFIQHFESGGTFLNFDPKAVKDYYAEQLKEGTSIASKAKPANA
ncbi:MAG: DUF697 domain-containing protein [Methylovulum sp.]|jgi:uncharacterized protein (DUF697 family)|nr:DUF697 domain-containing protein [Methylovulum sp.]MCF7998626.1 DUF697 domain-containing protein [Methylovulum sp.]MCF8006338.1 DUF697 domain-containing protein [Methylovulum sp.]